MTEHGDAVLAAAEADADADASVTVRSVSSASNSARPQSNPTGESVGDDANAAIQSDSGLAGGTPVGA